MERFIDVIGRWPRPAELASDLGFQGVRGRGLVQQWKIRDAIDGSWWADIALAAARRGFHDVTLDLLAQIARRSRLAKGAGHSIQNVSTANAVPPIGEKISADYTGERISAYESQGGAL